VDRDFSRVDFDYSQYLKRDVIKIEGEENKRNEGNEMHIEEGKQQN